jgi:hypothetical protein
VKKKHSHFSDARQKLRFAIEMQSPNIRHVRMKIFEQSLRLIIFLLMKHLPKPGLRYLEARVALSATIDGSALREDADRA